MANGLDAYLHMDDQWMWRFFILDKVGKPSAISERAYFTRDEADKALGLYREVSVIAH